VLCDYGAETAVQPSLPTTWARRVQLNSCINGLVKPEIPIEGLTLYCPRKSANRVIPYAIFAVVLSEGHKP
jgi:hypothetical protein